MEFNFNKYQSPITQEILEKYPQEIQEQFMQIINGIPLVKSLIAEDRPHAINLPRKDGKIIVDITKPHILENMDYFRPAALHFKKYGCYTNLTPNKNPKSEYGKWIREEIRRCYEGYVRESDGEWITGDYYFFLNYCPIQISKKEKGSKKRSQRVIDFPNVWEGHYYLSHYLEQARDNGHHAFMLAARGRGKSYFSASRVAKRFVLGESKEVNKKVQVVVTASERKYIQGANQILDMFVYYIDFLANNTQFPARRLTNSLHDMQWTMGYIDADNGTKKGTLNSVTGITSKDDESKLRGSRGQLYVIEEAGCHLKGTEVRMYDGSTKKVEDISIGDVLMGDDGTPRNVSELYSGTDNMYKITLSNGDYQVVNSKHPVIYKTYDWNKNVYIEHLSTAPELMKMNISKGYYISKSDAVNYPYQNLTIDPYWLGLWLGDGDATRMAVSNEDSEVLDWLENYCNEHNYEYTKRYLPQSKRCYNFNISAKNKVLQDEFKRLELKGNKHIPDCYKYNSKEVVAKVVAGLIDTDGSYDCRKHCYEITQLHTRKNIIYDIKEMCEYLGLRCTVSTRLTSKKAKGAGHLTYRLRIRGNYILPIKIARKKQTLRSGFRNKKSWTDYSFKVEEYGIGEYYGFTVDKNNLFLLKDYTIVHNTFPRLLQLYAVLRPSVEDGSNVFGQIFGYGCVCAGTKVWTNDGRYINIEDLKKEDGIIGYENDLPVKNSICTLLEPKEKPCIRITYNTDKLLACSIDHPILKQIIHTPRIKGTLNSRNRTHEEVWVRADELKIGDRIIEGRYIGAFGNDVLDDARLIGMLIGDGSYGFNNTPKFSNEDEELLNYIKSKYQWSLNKEHTTKQGKLYQEIRVKNICQLLRKVGIYGQTKTSKRLPIKYQTLTEQDTKDLLAGLFDTDGCVCLSCENTTISLVQSNKEILEQVQLLLRKFGIISRIVKNKPNIRCDRKDKNPWYILSIGGRVNIRLFKKYIPIIQNKKINKLNEICAYFDANPIVKKRCWDDEKIIIRTISKIEDIGIQTIYNLSAEQSHTYLANNIITHNTAADSESDFSSMQEIMYNPKGYNVQELENVYDIEGQGRKEFTYFFPSYMNMAECYDKDGNSDVIKALFEILKDRYVVKYNSTDIRMITKRMAELPITPKEAVLQTSNNLFPVSELQERLLEIDNNPSFYNDTYIGELALNPDGTVKFNPTLDTPIRDFKVNDNNIVEGALEIYEMPVTDINGKVIPERYIIGHDPVDNDEDKQGSLSSTFVLDLWTDRIVAEYTGRKRMADDNFEVLRRLCIFYNAKCLYEQNIKGCFAYFSQKNCLYLLADTPEYLVDKQLIKTLGYGNTSKGVRATLPINNYANKLIQQWMLKPVIKVTKDPTTGQDIEVQVPNLFNIKNRALLKECILYTPLQGNYDRIRALGLVMLYREMFIVMYQGILDKGRSYVPEDYIGNDPFFDENYNNPYDNEVESY